MGISISEPQHKDARFAKKPKIIQNFEGKQNEPSKNRNVQNEANLRNLNGMDNDKVKNQSNIVERSNSVRNQNSPRDEIIFEEKSVPMQEAEQFSEQKNQQKINEEQLISQTQKILMVEVRSCKENQIEQKRQIKLQSMPTDTGNYQQNEFEGNTQEWENISEYRKHNLRTLIAKRTISQSNLKNKIKEEEKVNAEDVIFEEVIQTTPSLNVKRKKQHPKQESLNHHKSQITWNLSNKIYQENYQPKFASEIHYKKGFKNIFKEEEVKVERKKVHLDLDALNR